MKQVPKTPPCAWCLSEQKKPAGEGSHGICKTHADQMMQQWAQAKKRLSGGARV